MQRLLSIILTIMAAAVVTVVPAVAQHMQPPRVPIEHLEGRVRSRVHCLIRLMWSKRARPSITGKGRAPIVTDRRGRAMGRWRRS